MQGKVKVFFDGGCRPEPEGMESAVVVRGVSYIRRDLGPGTSMDAEWLALLHAIAVARDLGLSDPVFLGDALAVIGQANGVTRCPAAYARHLQALRATGAPPRIRYVKRAQNLAGIALGRLHVR